MSHDPVGYAYDAAIYHPECFPEGVDPDNNEEVSAIFNWEDDAFSSCDVCNEPLIEREELPLSHGLVIICDSQAVEALEKALEQHFVDGPNDVEQVDSGTSQMQEQGFIIVRWNDRINGGFVGDLKGWDGVQDVIVFQDFSIEVAA